jgi:predicted  nucleic acid-binding Zn-ribbon protein
MLMAATSLALSVASGWTTWDGLSNFASSEALSLLITFGIQGVLLVSAWLVAGELARRAQIRSSIPPNPFAEGGRWAFGYGHAGYSGLTLVALWLMLAVSMSASLFFSFDSLFEKVFGDRDRAQAAKVRTQNAVASLLAAQELQLRIATSTATAELLGSPQWTRYAVQLEDLQTSAFRAPAALKAQALEDEKSRTPHLARVSVAIGQNKVRLDTAVRQLRDNHESLERLEAGRSAVASRIASIQQSISEKKLELNRQMAEAQREERGLSPSKKQGRGPRYRQLIAELNRLGIEVDRLIQDKELLSMQLVDLDKRRAKLDAVRTTLTGRRSELQQGLAGLREQQAKLQSGKQHAAEAGRVLNGSLRDLGQFMDTFIGAPSPSALEKLRESCKSLHRSLVGARAALPLPGANACNTDGVRAQMAELVASVQRLEAYSTYCAASDRISRMEVGPALQLAQECLAKASLPPREADALAARLQDISLRRDDLAHHFIVSSNAFLDGNPLAYLALAIAVVIDGLVLASSFCGSHVLGHRSSFVTPPEQEREKAARLIDTIFGPSPSYKARHLLEITEARPKGKRVTYLVDASKSSDERRSDLELALQFCTIMGLAKQTGNTARYELEPVIFELIVATAVGKPEAKIEATADECVYELLEFAVQSDIRELTLKLLDAAVPAPYGNELLHAVELARPVGPGNRAESQELSRLLKLGVAWGLVAVDPDRKHRFVISGAFYQILASSARYMEVAPDHEDHSADSAQTQASSEAARPVEVSAYERHSGSPSGVACIRVLANKSAPLASGLACSTPTGAHRNQANGWHRADAIPIALDRQQIADYSSKTKSTETLVPTGAAECAYRAFLELVAALRDLEPAIAVALEESELACRAQLYGHGYSGGGKDWAAVTNGLSEWEVEQNFDILHARACGVGLVLDWLSREVDKRELLSDFQILENRDAGKLETFVPLLRTIKELGEPAFANRSSELAHRIDLLVRSHTRFENIETLMP